MIALIDVFGVALAVYLTLVVWGAK
jgi:hypothetical protein